MWRSRQPLADRAISPAEAEEPTGARHRLVSAGKRRPVSARQRRRPISARRRRVLARGLRQAADRGQQRDRARRRLDLLLRDRVAAVRPELLELADSLERSGDPDPAAVAELRRLLTDGCHSPLYNPDVHIAELRATLYYLRAGLTS